MVELEQAWVELVADFLEEFRLTVEFHRGLEYAVGGRVLDVVRAKNDQALLFRVQGTEALPYLVHMRCQDGQLMTHCTCAVEQNCKHSVAAALWFNACAQLVGVALFKDPVGGRYPALLRAPEKHLEELRPILKRTVAAEPPPAEETGPPWWETYLAAPESERPLILRKAVARRIPAQHQQVVDAVLARVRSASDMDPLSVLESLDRMTDMETYFIRRHVRPQDERLADFLKGTQAAELRRQREESKARNRVRAWLQKESAPAPAALAVDLRVVLGLDDDWRRPPRVHATVFSTNKRGESNARPASSLSTLMSEWKRNQRSLPFPDDALALWLDQQALPSRFGGSSQLFHMNSLAEWAAAFCRHGRMSWWDGRPVQPVEDVDRLVILRDDGNIRWAVEQKGSPPSHTWLGDAQLFVDGSMREAVDAPIKTVWRRRGDVLCRVDIGRLPVDVLSDLMLAPSVDLGDATQAGRLTPMLRAFLPDDAAAAERAVTTRIPVTPTVVVELVDASFFNVEVTASGGGFRFSLGADRSWLPQPALATNDAETLEVLDAPDGAAAPVTTPAPGAIEYEPRRPDVEPVESWLAGWMPASVTTQEKSGVTRFSWKPTRKILMELLTVWGQRPRGVRYLGNKAFRDLVTLRQAPRFRVKIKEAGVNFLSVSVSMEKEMDALSLEETVVALRDTAGDLVTLRGGRVYRREDVEAYQKQVQSLLDLGLAPVEGEQSVHALAIARTPQDVLTTLGQAGAEMQPLKDAVMRVASRFEGVPVARVPAPTHGYLRPYQKAGTDFLCWACGSLGGALLADDMGLGKTLQVLAAVATLHSGVRKQKPTLVVCPMSVVENWKREAQRFTPGLSVEVMERGKDRLQLLQRLNGVDVVVTNYALMRRDIEALKAVEWRCIVVDEAQAIKNAQSDTARAIKSLKADHRLAMTGTPIENRLEDLASIMEFVVPGYLAGVPPDVEGAGALRFLRARLRPVLLRRTKKEVAPELPPRIEERLDCEMTAGQKRLYLTEIKAVRQALKRAPGEVVGPRRIEILAALTRLRQLCCDPGLLSMQETSGKVEEVMELLTTLLAEGHKVLLFSQFVRMLERLEPLLTARGFPYRMLTGETRERQALVDAFEADPTPQVFLISLKAGGAGLNLVSASHVVLFDPWWNPAVEAQAIDRAHRIGQDKTVVAFRLVAKGTVEERILELQDRKRALFAGVLADEAFNSALSREDLEFILSDG